MDRDNLFQHLVLNALWVIILALFGRKDRTAALNFQAGAIRFGDTYGTQGDRAAEVRRETTYRNLPDIN